MNFQEAERKWQGFWEEKKIFATPLAPKKKYYVLEMFAYPSGDIHIGHFRNYTIGDAIARFKKKQGYDILHPFGWDAFGLPAEEAAIKRKIHPQEWTLNNISVSRTTLKQVGISYDWDREIITCLPDYYRWNQWIFLKMFEKGLAYQAKSLVNWCPGCKTVLANEQVQEGTCWRCHQQVTKKELLQWFFKITEYAERLLNDLDKPLKWEKPDPLLETEHHSDSESTAVPDAASSRKQKDQNSDGVSPPIRKPIEWPEHVKSMQKNWIGKSEGAKIVFKLDPDGIELPVFTTRPDTLFGVTFISIAPEHPLTRELAKNLPQEKGVLNFIEKAVLESEMMRTAAGDKNGVFTGRYALHPLTGEKVPIWTADYVLAGYGTGIVMGVPAHDQRDFLFAQKYRLPIKSVILPREQVSMQTLLSDNQPKTESAYSPETLSESIPGRLFKQLSKESPYKVLNPPTQTDEPFTQAYEEPGIMINSGEFSGLDSEKGKKKVTEKLKEKKLGDFEIRYKLRDWLISRQRYWGTPIPIIHCSSCGAVPVPESELPVKLPENVQNFIPQGRSPLEDVKEFFVTVCPKCCGQAHRDPDTMDTFVDSSWYFLRYTDSKNNKLPFTPEKADQWMPVDQYIGGVEHATGHLLYCRFITKVLHDMGYVSVEEPAFKLFNHGMVLDKHGEVMSKSKGNVVSPAYLMEKFGVDAARIAMFFAAPAEKELLWNEEGVGGAVRFLNRIWRYAESVLETSEENARQSEDTSRQTGSPSQELLSKYSGSDSEVLNIKLHATIQKATEDLERFSFHTAVAALMELLNLMEEETKNGAVSKLQAEKCIEIFAHLLSPFAPHFAEELWEKLKNPPSIFESPWPTPDEKALLILKSASISIPSDVTITANTQNKEGASVTAKPVTAEQIRAALKGEVELVVQINGKVKDHLIIPANLPEEEIKTKALNLTKIKSQTDGKEIKKVIVIPKKLINIVV